MNLQRQMDCVQWLPWEEGFARAQAERKPLLIALDGIPCMEEDTARFMMRYFVPVRISRREQPGAAVVYTRAADLLCGMVEGPIAVLADSYGNPFFVQTQEKPRQLASVLCGVALHWSSDPTKYESAGATVCRQLEGVSRSVAAGRPERQLFDTRFRWLQSRYDRSNGGFGTGAKSLQPQDLLFLLGYYRLTGNRHALNMGRHTLHRLACSAVRDQIGGGFFRGATDTRWEQPAAEKRLVDQAWMLETYLTAYRLSGDDAFRMVAKEIADFVLRELRLPCGGFAAGQRLEDGFGLLSDADVCRALGETDGKVFCKEYSVGAEKTMPHLFHSTSPHEDIPLLQTLRMKLYQDRMERGGAQTDACVLLGWNGLMIAALAHAGRVLGGERYLAAACDAEEFLRSRLVTTTELLRRWSCGGAGGEATLEDYAGYALGLVELYRAGCGGECLRRGAKVMARADALFSDWQSGGYYLTRAQGKLPVRPKPLWDEDVPSAWSIALRVLTLLAAEIPHPGLQRRSLELADFAAGVARSYDCSYALTALMEKQK